MSFDLANLRIYFRRTNLSYKNTVLKQIFLSFYWFIQDIYTILLSIDVK